MKKSDVNKSKRVIEKVNPKVVYWVLDIYLNYPYSSTSVRLCDFKQKYEVSYPTMYRYLPLFFNISERSYFSYGGCSACILTKKQDLELLFNTLKNLNCSRSFLNFLSLFFSTSTAVEVIIKSMENFKLQEQDEKTE